MVCNSNLNIYNISMDNQNESCEHYICPGKYFKCPRSYCLPWRLVCNGLWECPGGREEMHCNHTACPGMFRCKNSSICISVDNLCDSFHDCHSYEDEHFCSINQIANCPLNCSCLLFSMTCEHVNLDFISHWICTELNDHLDQPTQGRNSAHGRKIWTPEYRVTM